MKDKFLIVSIREYLVLGKDEEVGEAAFIKFVVSYSKINRSK